MDLVFLAISSGNDDDSMASGASFLRVLRIVRLTRIVRVLKFSKSISGVMVLLRTVGKSMGSFALLVCFCVFMCILAGAIIGASSEIGQFIPDAYQPPLFRD